jgi:hypothetical protein
MAAKCPSMALTELKKATKWLITALKMLEEALLPLSSCYEIAPMACKI